MILHFCSQSVWTDALQSGSYRADTLESQGFIHLSTADQVHLPANALIAGRTDQILLEVDETKLHAELRWEPGVPDTGDGMVFPHLYGPLNTDAVVAVHPFPPGPDGKFSVPHSLR